MLKSNLAQMLKLPENQMRVIAPEVGGSFAASSMSTPRKGCWVILALKLNCPVKWTEERSENFQATIHGRGRWVKLKRR